jgi:hypothetical protein
MTPIRVRASLPTLLAIAAAGCTPAEAAPFGKLLFGLMVVFLVAIPVVFARAWRSRKGR